MKDYADFKNSMNEMHKTSRMISLTLSNLERLKGDHQKRIAKLDKKIEDLTLPPKDDKIKDAIMNVKGVEGEVLFRYYIEGESMKEIAKSLNYSEDNGWKLLSKGLKQLYEEFKTLQ